MPPVVGLQPTLDALDGHIRDRRGRSRIYRQSLDIASVLFLP